MKQKIIIIITLLLLFICINTVNAEDNILEDNTITNNTTTIEETNTNNPIEEDTNLTDNTQHNHTQISSITDSPVKATIRYAPGGTFANFQTIINGAANGDVIEVQGDYYQAATARININKRVTINGNQI